MSSNRDLGLVVVPVHNEGAAIAEVASRLVDRSPCCDLLFVDDGSRDRSRDILGSAGYDVVHHPVNLGYLEALRTGLAIALDRGYGFVVFFDGDGQHRIEDLNRLVSYHEVHHEDDLLIGSRYLSGQRAAGPIRHLVSRIHATLVHLVTGQRIYDVTSGLKLLNRHAAEVMDGLVLEDGHAEFLVFMARSGCRIRELPITVEPRRDGSTMYGLPKAVMYALRTSFLLLLAALSSRPARAYHQHDH
jgi:glycosyltransferase involved in cell wall biosynthesis